MLQLAHPYPDARIKSSTVLQNPYMRPAPSIGEHAPPDFVSTVPLPLICISMTCCIPSLLL